MNKYQRAKSVEIKRIMRKSKRPINYKKAKRIFRYRSHSRHIVGTRADIYIIDDYAGEKIHSYVEGLLR